MGKIKTGEKLPFDYGFQPDMKVQDFHILYDKELGRDTLVCTGTVDLKEITLSHQDEVGIDNFLARIAMGDTSMLRDPGDNLVDVSGLPEDPFALRKYIAEGLGAVQVLTDLGLTDEEGNKLSGEAIAGMEKEQLLKVLSAKVAAENKKEEVNNG